MTGELAAFAFFVTFTCGVLVWLLHRARRAVEELDREIEELKRDPP